ncbi:MAG: type II toxin-antitoxin system RelE/ParE family toxin [Nitrospira sp.]
MAYEVELTPAAQRQWKSFDKPIQRQLLQRVTSLADNPRPNGVEKLQDADDLYRIRSGNYRIIYTINDKKLLVLIVKIGDRKEVYKR